MELGRVVQGRSRLTHLTLRWCRLATEQVPGAAMVAVALVSNAL